MNMIKYKKITEEDIEQVFFLYCKEENKIVTKDDIIKAKKIYKKILERDCYTFGAFLDKKIVGVINVNKILDYYPGYSNLPYIHLETFIIDKEYQNRGIGSNLFKEVIELIKKEGCSYILIQSNNEYVQKIAKKSGLTQSLYDMRYDFT